MKKGEVREAGGAEWRLRRRREESGRERGWDDVGDGGLGGQAQRPAQFFLGTVLAGSQEGLKVACNGLELDREDIWINETLKRDYTYQVSLDGGTGRFFQLSGTLSGPVTCPGAGMRPQAGERHPAAAWTARRPAWTNRT